MTRKGLAWLLGFVIVASLGCAWHFSQKNEIKHTAFHVAILKTACHPALDLAEKAFIKVLTQEFKKDISFVRRSQENSMTQGQLIAQQFTQDKKINLVLSLGTNASLSAYSKINTIPLIMGAIGNPDILGIIEDDSLTCCFSDMVNLDAHINLISSIKPSIARVGVIFSFKESYARFFAACMHHRLKAAHIAVIDIPVTDYETIPKLIEHYKDSFDLLWAPTDNGISTAISLLAATLKRLNKPFISCDHNVLDYGALATLGIDYAELGTRTGHAAVRLLRKERKPSDYGLNNHQNTRLVINHKRCEELGITLPKNLPEKYD